MLQGISKVVASVAMTGRDGQSYHGTHRVMFHHIKVGQVRRCDLFTAYEHISGHEPYVDPKSGKLTRNGIVH